MLSIIVAMTEERLIGAKGRLPWHLPEDLKRFKEITMGSPIVMGRKTFESIGCILPGRRNIIITRNPNYSAEGAEVAHSLDEAIAAAEKITPHSILSHPRGSEDRKADSRLHGNDSNADNEIFVIGGAEIFQLALPKANRLYLTIIHKRFEGDTYFPEFDLEKDFEITAKSTHETSGKNKLLYTFITAERIA